MKSDFYKKNKKESPLYPFYSSRPYIIHRHKMEPIFYALVLIFFIYEGIRTNDWMYEMWGFILMFIICLIIEIKDRKKIIRIDTNGITTDETGTITWPEINHCSYSITGGKDPIYWLEIKMENNHVRKIMLNDYSYSKKKLAAAIDFYSKRQLFVYSSEDKEVIKKITTRIRIGPISGGHIYYMGSCLKREDQTTIIIRQKIEYLKRNGNYECD